MPALQVKNVVFSRLNLVQEETKQSKCLCAVCCTPSVFFLSGAFVRNCKPYLDDIWYVGEARAEGVHHASFWTWLMLIEYRT